MSDSTKKVNDFLETLQSKPFEDLEEHHMFHDEDDTQSSHSDESNSTSNLS